MNSSEGVKSLIRELDNFVNSHLFTNVIRDKKDSFGDRKTAEAINYLKTWIIKAGEKASAINSSKRMPSLLIVELANYLMAQVRKARKR